MASSRRDFLQLAAAAGLGHLLIPHDRYCLGQEAGPPPPADDWPDNPFLRGNYAPVHEEVTVEQLKIIGQLPRALEGMYVRNGPNPQFPPKAKYHWFDGDGMLHGAHLQDGKASYRNRYVRTSGFDAERSAGKALWGGLLDRPDVGRLLKGEELFKNAANTSLVWHDGRLLALWEGGPPHEVRLPELKTVGRFDYDEKLKHPFTAHPKLDPETGEMIFFGYQPTLPYLSHSVVSADGTLAHTTGIKLPRPVMMHDFAVTRNYSLFLDLPMTLSVARSMRNEPAMAFEPDLGARVGILPRHADGDQIRWFDVGSCYVFHTLNAYEEGQSVVLEACRFQEFPDLLINDPSGSEATLGGSGGPDSPKLYRWRFDLTKGDVEETPLDDLPVEFPRVNDRLLGRPAQFGYAMSAAMGGLVKYDLKQGTRTGHDHGPGRLGGEGVFVPKPDAKHEDDGWLITYVYDQAQQHSELVVVDAREMNAPPRARVVIPARIPFGFHGVWVSADALSRQNT
jgi:carotenoid cleavage dioxygenase